MPETKPSARACLAISSFRNDESVLALLDRAERDGALALFERILVVDSIGTGRMAEVLARRSVPIEYHCVPWNLGSAGNLAMRLRLAAEGASDAVYAVNHDGSVERQTVLRLLDVAASRCGFGALYPLRRLTRRDGLFDLSGRYSIPVPSHGTRTAPPGPVLRVFWGSSNPALYSLEPVRLGLAPWDDLWLGFEDMGYGWLLEDHGYPQFLVTDAITDDGYEFRRVGWSPLRISDKPSWYAYYFARNLLLLARRTRISRVRKLAVAGRIALETGVTIVARRQKRERLVYLASGVIDGLRGRNGKWRLP
jgi:hypothetical protein